MIADPNHLFLLIRYVPVCRGTYWVVHDYRGRCALHDMYWNVERTTQRQYLRLATPHTRLSYSSAILFKMNVETSARMNLRIRLGEIGGSLLGETKCSWMLRGEYWCRWHEKGE